MENSNLTAGIVAPSRKITTSRLKQGIKRLFDLGFDSIYDKSITSTDIYHAGTVERRVKEISAAFINPKIDVIFSATGGYGSLELLPFLDYDLIEQHKKPFVGYSDICALLIAINKKTSSPVIHGPMPCSAKYSLENKYFKEYLLAIKGKPFKIRISSKKIYSHGNFSGKIVGGNLTIVSSLNGTPYELDTVGKVFFLEEVNETPQATYNLLVSLHLAGKFDHIVALVMGRFNRCGKYLPLLEKFLSRLKVPIIYQLSLGHSKHIIPIRINSHVSFDKLTRTITFLNDS